MKRVVVTGMGLVTPIGNTIDEFWGNLRAGKSGIDYITRFDTEAFKCHIAGEVKDFNPEDYISKKDVKRMDLYAQYALAAAKTAMENSGLDMEHEDPYRVGVITGSGIGGISTAENQIMTNETRGPGRVSPFYITMMISNMAAAHIAIEYGAKGPNYNVVSACASGTNAVGEAFRLIQHGTCDAVVAGGAEASITPSSVAGFCSLKALSTNNDNPQKASRPFDKNRDGFVMGEGAGILVLEELEHAKKRGANIICEVVGYGATDDAYHVTSPSPGGEGAQKAMEFALKDANLSVDDVTYINAHGTSTDYNDKFETAAIKGLFGDKAKNVAVSSTKSMMGHLLGAAGAVEAIICALAIRDSFIPATINYETPDEECDLDYVPNVGREQEVTYAMSNSLGFGGHNATIVLKKYDK
jgi:beta-ketoacyl-acyl-carrier-protein synthase II